ncbi:unnamed protein product [Fusarium graminearum]|uniref:Chromosome 2, complete genome n=2 Tax=Gibberella zeae TaxID=5518 RepID=A0A098DCK9_GIBZE|nr:unnamed protein product [Fusarium graminearum]CAF3486211.1 unnamed protein product [Fusarium graminearum]CAF3492949.1 unnamed protein product [Fusarium graminearum]CAG1976748.1 unnamed protein product [Fusarium graminearum]CAG1986627.1 unnamed protein product [Fusarium graminearum]
MSFAWNKNEANRKQTQDRPKTETHCREKYYLDPSSNKPHTHRPAMVVENHLISDHIVFAPEPNNDEEHVENRIIRLGDAK